MQPCPSAEAAGVPVAYQLPADGPLPQTYRVTLAIVDPKNPEWIISQFAGGVARTVTRENGGKFSEIWDGLDDNFMPVPPGEYAVKGIFMPAKKWVVDGEWHSVTPRFVTGASSWMPLPEQWDKPEAFGGDPVGSPLSDVAVGPNGVAVFYYQYLENGTNNPMFDLNKPVNYEQFLRAFNSGGAGGGTATATDGETVWSFCAEGGPKYVYRADGKSFGVSHGANRSNGYLPDGWVTAMAAWRDDAAKKSFVYVAQRGKIVSEKGARHVSFVECDTEFADKVTVHDGENGKVLAEIPVSRPRGLAVRGGVLYSLHAEGGGFAVSTVTLASGLPQGKWRRLFAVPKTIAPADLEVDSHLRIYLSDPDANKVHQLSRDGELLRSYGRLAAQTPGSYDPLTFISPAKLATWTDSEGRDRLIVVEQGGPNRASEWSDDGKLIRGFLTLQTKANDGYAIDPQHPQDLYIAGQQGWLTRFKVDYEKHTWTVDAVWPHVGDDPRAPRLDKPHFIRANGREYLACSRSFNVYRHDGDRWLLSAAILRDMVNGKQRTSFWHDTNGNGRVDDDEVTPVELPGRFLTYHGQNWLDDFSMLAMNQGGGDVWRLAPSGFDAHGNPIFTGFTKLFSDPVFEARRAGTADAIHGGNELADNFPSDWMQADGSPAEGFYVQARGGKNFSANEGPQHKLTRYVPDGKGGYRAVWRTGRTAMQRVAETGEMYGAMRVHRPINGLVSVVDQSRCGVLLFSEDGLYVDTIFPDSRRGFTQRSAGIYPQGGEFFAGTIFPNRENGKIYFAMGKYTPLLFEAEGWSLKENPVRPLATVQKTVSIAAAQIASPPEIALSVRGGAGAARLARFSPALGGVALDGMMTGWESSEPIHFSADKDQTVEVRACYDTDHIYLRWHARLAVKFDPKPLQPLDRIFTHDRLGDTLSFYFQSDPGAKPGGSADGRPGDARVVFGMFKNGAAIEPAALAMFPKWTGKGKTSPNVYATPVGRTAFEHVGALEGAKLGGTIDEDGKGFVIAAAIPRATLAPQLAAFTGGYQTMVNFEATFSGHNKFWWANRDGSASRETYDEPTEARLYPGSWAPAQFQPLDKGVVIRNWIVCGPFGGPGAEKFKADPNGVVPGTTIEMKKAVREFCEAAAYPPDSGEVDLKAVFKGDMLRGYWPDPREVRWKAASIADLDTRVILGGGAETWYGATWIRVPTDMELEFQFQSHPMTTFRWSLNGQPIQTGEYKEDAAAPHLRVAKKTLTLRSGWNQIFFRGYCIGYPKFRGGVVLSGPEEKLWNLQLSANPPPAK